MCIRFICILTLLFLLVCGSHILIFMIFFIFTIIYNKKIMKVLLLCTKASIVFFYVPDPC